MKNIAKILVFTILFNYIFSITNVFAVDNTKIEEIICDNKFSLAYANQDKSIRVKSCHDTFPKAKEAMKNDIDINNENLIILDESKKIIDAKYGLISLDVNRNENVPFYYNSNTTGTTFNDCFYVNGWGYYNGADAALINILDNRTAYVKISGQEAYLKNNSYNIVPISFIKSSSFYLITKDEIKHCLTSNITLATDKYNNCILLGKKPLNIDVGEYYSYDGNYFYSDYISMLKDYKENIKTNAINYLYPYYNYYLYLSHRTKSTYSSISIDEYFRKTTSPNIIGKTYGNTSRSAYSMFYGEGYGFIDAEEKHGANALLVLSVARNEAGPYGNSNIAIRKNNIFGHNAIDGDSFNQATGYLTVRYSILQHASNYVSYGYTDPFDIRYRGSNLGNKKNGMNVFYATDPYWGEKAASNYYKFDKASGLNDYNYYQIGVSKELNINFKTQPNNQSKTVYTTNLTDIPITIVEEVKGESINGNDIWYKTLSDLLVDSNYNMPAYNTNYNWNNSYLYVHSSQFKKVNEVKKLNNPADTFLFADANYSYTTFSNSGKLSPRVGKLKNNAMTYFESSLTNINKEVLLLKNKLITIFEKCSSKDGNVISYLVSTDNYANQKHWISSNDIEFMDNDFLKVNMNIDNYFYDMYNNPNKNVIPQVGSYTNNFLVITDATVINNKTWLKVQYSLTNNVNSFTWVISDYNEGTLEYTLKKIYEAPVIDAKDREVLLDSKFNPLENIKAYDKEDGDLTNKLRIISNNVNTAVKGTYEVIYEVSDLSEKITTKKINITVNGFREKEGLFYFDNLRSTVDNKLLVSGFFANKGIDNKEGLIHNIIFKEADGIREYKFKMDNWRGDIPFEMSNIEDIKPCNYSGGWFKKEIDITDVLPGEYIIYIEVINGVNRSYRLFNNLGLKDTTKKHETLNKSYTISTNYYEKTLPISIIIRNSKLIASSISKTLDLMYNFFNELYFSNNKLNILGTSHNVGIEYNKDTLIDRKLIFENKDTFKQTSFDVGSIDDGPYKVELRVPDLKDKTRVWFRKSLDISNMEVGEYIIYLKTTVGDFSDYGELSDIAYKELTSKMIINNKEFNFKRIDSKRFRIELNIIDLKK